MNFDVPLNFLPSLLQRSYLSPKSLSGSSKPKSSCPLFFSQRFLERKSSLLKSLSSELHRHATKKKGQRMRLVFGFCPTVSRIWRDKDCLVSLSLMHTVRKKKKDWLHKLQENTTRQDCETL